MERLKSSSLFQELARLVREHAVKFSIPMRGPAGKVEIVPRGRCEVLRDMIIVVKFHLEHNTGTNFTQQFGAGMMLSTIQGTLLVRTRDLLVLQTNSALRDFWMLPESGGVHTGLAGQSLWAIVHWDDFQVMEDLQDMLRRRDRSVVGRHFDFGLIRHATATDAGVGGASVVVRRKVEVLYLSEDGAVALLGVNIKEEDRKPLEIGEEGREFLRQDMHVFKMNWFPRQRAHLPAHPGRVSPSQGAGKEVRSGLSVLDLEGIVHAITKYAPEMYAAMGPDDDGVMRFMCFTRLRAPESLMGDSCYYVPCFSVRAGDIQQGDCQEDFALILWYLNGDDEHSRLFPWRFKDVKGRSKLERLVSAPHGAPFLASFWTRRLGCCDLGQISSYCHTRVNGPLLVNRCTGMAQEGRPAVDGPSRWAPQSKFMSEWEGMEKEKLQVRDNFFRFKGCNFIHRADVLSGIWHSVGEDLCEVFELDHPDHDPVDSIFK